MDDDGGVDDSVTLISAFEVPAAEAGVSLPTVSKVVNGRPDVAPTMVAAAWLLLCLALNRGTFPAVP